MMQINRASPIHGIYGIQITTTDYVTIFVPCNSFKHMERVMNAIDNIGDKDND